MIQMSSELTYADLDNALQRIGYTREESAEERIYRHPADKNARIRYPVLPFSEPVREYHRVAARQIADGFGIIEAADFDLLLVRLAHERKEANITTAN